MSMSQFGSDLAKDRIERLLEQARTDVPTRPSTSRSAGLVGRVIMRFRRFGSTAFRSRHPGRELRLPR
jgi:hypothetical protein